MPEFHEHILTFHFEGIHQLQTKALFKWIGMKQITVKTLRMSQLNQNNDNQILSFSSIGQKIIIMFLFQEIGKEGQQIILILIIIIL